ncbi:MAG: Gfo/Idh/MocA family oxidoreductase [Thermoguttaceae bacterium]|jgi:hypothetical protein
MIKKNSTTRREFLKRAGLAAAAPYIISASALGQDGRPPASERIVMAGIGVGNQGGGDMGAFLRRREVQYVAVCDVKQSMRDRGKERVNKQYGNNDCAVYKDFRELLARKDIDAVHVATPDHWHAIITIEACRQGKDVYCQKPESLTIKEGRAMVQAARRYGCVVSGGSQRVLDDHGELAERCWNGDYGTIKEIYVNCGPPSTPCYLPGKPVDSDVDWDMWLGPAPWAPYHPYRIGGSYSIDGKSWRSWCDYSGGGMTDWGAHRFGGAMFAAGIADQGPVEIIPPDGKDVKYLTYRFANGLLMCRNPDQKEGLSVVGTPGEKLPAKTMPRYKGTGGIYGDFLYCVRTREKPFRDIELAHRTATVCHLGIIAYNLNRPLKWDPDKEEFPGDAEANRFLDRAKREPWQL